FRTRYQLEFEYDALLRYVHGLAQEAICHVPLVLYHQRRSSNGDLLNEQSERKRGEAASCLNEHFTRVGLRAVAIPIPNGNVRVRYAVPTPPPLVSILIPTRNAMELVRQCIDSIRAKTTYQRFEILLIDNGSDDVNA